MPLPNGTENMLAFVPQIFSSLRVNGRGFHVKWNVCSCEVKCMNALSRFSYCWLCICTLLFQLEVRLDLYHQPRSQVYRSEIGATSTKKSKPCGKHSNICALPECSVDHAALNRSILTRV